MRLVKGKVALSIHDERVWLQSESHVRDLDLGVQISIISQRLLQGHDELAKVQLGLQINILLHSRLGIGDLADTRVLEPRQLHHNLPLVEEQICLHLVPLDIFAVSSDLACWLDFQRQVVDIGIDFRQKYVFLHLVLNVLQDHLEILVHRLLDEIFVHSQGVVRLRGSSLTGEEEGRYDRQSIQIFS